MSKTIRCSACRVAVDPPKLAKVELRLEGEPGPHRVEQPFAKPHQVEFDPSGRFIVVPDKGVDRIFTCRIDHCLLYTSDAADE